MTQGDDPNATAEKCETRSVNEGTHVFSLTRSNQSAPSKHHRYVVRISPNVLSKQGSWLWDSYQTFWWQCKCSVDIRPTLESRRIGGFPFTSVPPTLACQHIYLRHPLRASRPLPLIHGRRDRKASKKAACRHPKSVSTAQSFTTLSRTLCTIYSNIYRTIKLNDIIFQHVYVCMFQVLCSETRLKALPTCSISSSRNYSTAV